MAYANEDNVIENEGDITEESPRLIKTWLSQPPKPSSFFAALVTFIIMGFVSQMYWVDFMGMAKFLYASKEAVFSNFEVWRLFSAVFIHADLEHFLSNMYMLTIFSYFIYAYTDKLVFPWLSFLLAGVVNAISIYSYAPQVKLLGASGLVYLLAGTWLTLFFLIQRQYALPARIMRVVGIAAVILFPTSFSPTTSYRTHFIGFIVGVVLGVYYFVKNKQKIRSFEFYGVS